MNTGNSSLGKRELIKRKDALYQSETVKNASTVTPESKRGPVRAMTLQICEVSVFIGCETCDYWYKGLVRSFTQRRAIDKIW